MADGRGGDGAKAGVGDVVYYRVRGECGNAVMGSGRLGRDRCVEAVCGGRGGGRVRELLGR